MDKPNWSFAGAYGFPVEQNKKDTWNLIRNLATEAGKYWVYFRDLNNVLANNKK